MGITFGSAKTRAITAAILGALGIALFGVIGIILGAAALFLVTPALRDSSIRVESITGFGLAAIALVLGIVAVAVSHGPALTVVVRPM